VDSIKSWKHKYEADFFVEQRHGYLQAIGFVHPVGRLRDCSLFGSETIGRVWKWFPETKRKVEEFKNINSQALAKASEDAAAELRKVEGEAANTFNEINEAREKAEESLSYARK